MRSKAAAARTIKINTMTLCINGWNPSSRNNTQHIKRPARICDADIEVLPRSKSNCSGALFYYLSAQIKQNSVFYANFQNRIINRFFGQAFSRKRKLHYPADSVRSRAAPSSLSAESEILIHRALRKGREQANSKLYASKQSGGLFWKRGRPAREGVPL